MVKKYLSHICLFKELSLTLEIMIDDMDHRKDEDDPRDFSPTML